MGWQKTFTLAKRGKGCHLVTEEVLLHIQSGLRDVQVDITLGLAYFVKWLAHWHGVYTHISADWDALSVHVSQLYWTTNTSSIPCNLLQTAYFSSLDY